MITGFNPADMYAADHIKRVLKTFPGVFSGIGEFSIHKEFVSAKVAGEVASLTNPAVDRILDLAGEAGLVVIFHNDMDVPFAKAGTEPAYLEQMIALLRRHPKTTIIWAHMGLGRIVRPVQASASAPATERNPNHAVIVQQILADSTLRHVYFDISWDEVAKYILSGPDVTRRVAELFDKYPDRFLFGTDVVAPKDTTQYYAVFESYKPSGHCSRPTRARRFARGITNDCSMLRARRCGRGRKLRDGRHVQRQASRTKGNRIKRIERKRPDPWGLTKIRTSS